MNFKLVLSVTFWLLATVPVAVSQELIFKLPDGTVDKPYNQSVPEVLRSTYQRELVSEKGEIEWSALHPLGKGFAIDARGVIFGTPKFPGIFFFTVQAIDTAYRDRGATTLKLALTVVKNGHSEQGGGPALLPIRPGTPEQAKDQSGGAVVVTIGDFNPKQSSDVPLTVKSPSGVRLQALIFDKNGDPHPGPFTEALPAGEVRTTLSLKFSPGRNKLTIRDVTSGQNYATLTVDVAKSIELAEADSDTETATDSKGKPDAEAERPADAEKPVKGTKKFLGTDAPGAKAACEKTAAESGDFKVAYSSLVDRSASSVPVTVTVSDSCIGNFLVLVTEGGEEKEKAKDEKKPTSKLKSGEPEEPADKKKKVIYRQSLDCAKANGPCPMEINLPDSKLATAYFFDVTGVEDVETIDVSMFKDYEKAKHVIYFERKGDSAVSTISLNSLNTRGIVGFEQVGATASESTAKPFLDFFFTAPLWFKRETADLSRLSLWGNIRLAAVPSQISTLGVLPTNFANQVAEKNPSKLIQGFDFNVGPEFRIHTSRGFASLIPGLKQRTDVYLAAGFGAISPLNPSERDNVQIFNVPGTDSPQYEEFKARFPEAAASGKKYVAFTFPERDRFLRQFYAGFRFKTHFAKGGEVLNRFPAIFDLMLGRNEAVTGGKLKHTVLRMEGFYPLPIRSADFLYLYGTAMMTFGGGGVKINKPLFLDTPGSTVGLSSPDLFVVPNRQNNSDYYRIGVGIDLMKLFNRNPKEE
jgi:hypothetical protein